MTSHGGGRAEGAGSRRTLVAAFVALAVAQVAAGAALQWPLWTRAPAFALMAAALGWRATRTAPADTRTHDVIPDPPSRCVSRGLVVAVLTACAALLVQLSLTRGWLPLPAVAQRAALVELATLRSALLEPSWGLLAITAGFESVGWHVALPRALARAQHAAPAQGAVAQRPGLTQSPWRAAAVAGLLYAAAHITTGGPLLVFTAFSLGSAWSRLALDQRCGWSETVVAHVGFDVILRGLTPLT